MAKKEEINEVKNTAPETGTAASEEKTSRFSEPLRRKFRFGTNAIVLIALAIVVFVVLNLVLESFSTKLTIDMTKEQLFSIGDITKEEMEKLSSDVEIIALYDRVKGEADTQKVSVIKVLDLYDQFDHIEVRYIDPEANPGIITNSVGKANAGSYSAGDYIVKCGDKTKRISEKDMYVTSSTTSGWYSYDYQSGMQAEKKLTTAILFVTREKSPVVYYITGHQEEDIGDYSEILTYIEGLGCEVKELDLTVTDKMPDDAAVAILMGPKYDITGFEKTVLQQWLEQEAGQLAVCVDPSQIGVEFANLNQLLGEMYGLRLNNDVLFDKERRITASTSDSDFLAFSVSNGPIEKSNVYTVPVFTSRSIEVLSIDEAATYITHYPIISTASSAYSRILVGQDQTDVTGSYTVAAAAKNAAFDEVTHCIVFGSSRALRDDYYKNFGTYTRYALSIFAMGIDWSIDSYGDNAGNEIEVKNYSTSQLVLTRSQSNFLGIISAVVIPLIIIAIGVVIWLRRRHL